jgi:hypothetical protein
MDEQYINAEFVINFVDDQSMSANFKSYEETAPSVCNPNNLSVEENIEFTYTSTGSSTEDRTLMLNVKSTELSGKNSGESEPSFQDGEEIEVLYSPDEQKILFMPIGQFEKVK